MPPRNPYEPDGRDHVCGDCKRVFDSRGRLLDHRSRAHETIAPAPEPEEVPAS
jgi:hypothetical protein